MAKAKFTTAIDEDILKQMKIRAIEEDINVGELIEKSFKLYTQNDAATERLNKKLSLPYKYDSENDIASIKKNVEKILSHLDTTAL